MWNELGMGTRAWWPFIIRQTIATHTHVERSEHAQTGHSQLEAAHMRCVRACDAADQKMACLSLGSFHRAIAIRRCSSVQCVSISLYIHIYYYMNLYHVFVVGHPNNRTMLGLSIIRYVRSTCHCIHIHGQLNSNVFTCVPPHMCR